MPFDPLYISAGDLRSSITIQAPSTIHDEYGQPSQAFKTVLTTRAKIQTLSLRETYGQAGFSGQATYRITMRYQSATPIEAGYQIVHQGKACLVQSVENVLARNRIINALVV